SAFGDLILSATTAGTGAPEVNVTGAGLNILDGDTTPQTADGTAFGSADITSGTVQKVFNIQNTGSATLSSIAVTTTNSEFGLLTAPPTTIAAGGNANFTIAFNPTATGLRAATLSFTNNDANENPYNFSLQGTGTSSGVIADDLGAARGGVLTNATDGMCINMSPTPGSVSGYAQAVQDAGFKWTRQRLLWLGVEQSPGAYDFDGNSQTPNYDLMVSELNSRGIGVLFVINLNNNPIYPGLAGSKPFNAAGRTNVANFAKAAAARYAGAKVMFELHNEPNIPNFWPVDGNGDGTVTIAEVQQAASDYAALAQVVVPAMRSSGGDPNVFVIGPALAGRGGPYVGGQVGAHEYILKLKALNALSPLFDRISLHLYTTHAFTGDTQPEEGPETAKIDFYRGLINNPATNIMNTEQGWRTDGSAIENQLQASFNVRDHLFGLSKSVRFKCWFVWGNSPANAAFAIAGRPSETAARILSQELATYRFSQRISTGNAEQYVLEFVNTAGNKRLAAWNTTTTTPATYNYAPAANKTRVELLGATSTINSSGNLNLSIHPIYVRLP
ncbi:MAG: choice-of-anchor D domain-containing protein, partial [Opitutaceae bacterium]